VDYALVEDTGSTDGTPGDHPWLPARQRHCRGTVIEEPWRDFAYKPVVSRSQRCADTRTIDYALIIDADDVIVYEPGFDAVAFKAGADRGSLFCAGPFAGHRF